MFKQHFKSRSWFFNLLKGSKLDHVLLSSLSSAHMAPCRKRERNLHAGKTIPVNVMFYSAPFRFIISLPYLEKSESASTSWNVPSWQSRLWLNFWHFVDISQLEQVHAAKPDCECICKQHWDTLINVAALAEGGEEGQIYILTNGQTVFWLWRQKGLLSGRAEDDAQSTQAVSAWKESWTHDS